MAEKLKNKVTDGFQKGHPYGELPDRKSVV